MEGKGKCTLADIRMTFFICNISTSYPWGIHLPLLVENLLKIPGVEAVAASDRGAAGVGSESKLGELGK